ncbi:hypothetical protein P3X46_007659 [Hevea brasiliensis]|uniref:Peptidase M16 C-terminal domain-containing protein n=1 Tax=Hevea brasiliensis TaxID=3981 RepID=A0ABQ9MWN7_HEVBR|nr:hypothetical protein P3X46_007659 [Hevea brasiliensis]
MIYVSLGILALEVSKDSEKLQTSCSCVMKTIEHQASATVDDLKKVLLKINILEGEGSISPWDDEKIPEEIVATKPNPGPSILRDMVAGRRVEVGTKLGAYMRTFSGDCSPSDLETALQLVYQLFTKNVIPGEEDAKIVMQMAEEAVRAQERDPYTALADRGKELNYGNCYFFRPIRINDLRKVDPLKACKYFNSCFKDPSTFTVVIVGNLDPTIALPLILQYLGGIPKPPEPILHFNWDDLKGLPFTFPTSIIRPMVEAQCSVQLSFPVVLKNGTMVEEIHRVGFLSKLLETKIMQVLRFKHGQVDLALDEILRLQEEGPSDEDVSTVLELEQMAPENGLQLTLQRILPYPCKKQYTAVVLMPQTSRFQLLRSFFKSTRTSYARDAKIIASIAGLTVLALTFWRHSRSTLRS